MPVRQQFNFFNDWTEQQQNDFLTEYLIETAKYLIPIKFPNSPNCFFYKPHFKTQKYHGNNATNLAAILLLLVSRDIIWSIQFDSKKTPYSAVDSHDVYYVFLNDVSFLNDIDFDCFQYVTLDEVSKAMYN